MAVQYLIFPLAFLKQRVKIAWMIMPHNVTFHTVAFDHHADIRKRDSAVPGILILVASSITSLIGAHCANINIEG